MAVQKEQCPLHAGQFSCGALNPLFQVLAGDRSQ